MSPGSSTNVLYDSLFVIHRSLVERMPKFSKKNLEKSFAVQCTVAVNKAKVLVLVDYNSRLHTCRHRQKASFVVTQSFTHSQRSSDNKNRNNKAGIII